MTEKFDFVIIGGGGVGLAAAMYAGRLNLKTLVLGFAHGSELAIGGVITTTNVVENYPGFLKLTGQELAKKLEEHARDYDLVTIKEEKAMNIEKTDSGFKIETDKNSYDALTILFATGTKWKKLDVPGSEEYENKGVHYCALCDAPLYRDKVVAIVGGSDSAAKDALVTAEHSKKTYIIYRGNEIHPEPVNMERIKKNQNMEIINNTNIKEIKGTKFVEKVILDKPYKNSEELELDAVFIAIGHLPLSDLAKKLGVKTDEKDEIVINHMTSETNIRGVFAAGDITNKPFKQLITGVGDGCTAAYSAYEYINNQ